MKIKLNKKEFEAKKSEIEQKLKGWWKTVQKDAIGQSADGVPDIWSTIPKIDSKAAIKATTTIEDILGAEVHPSLIKQGGYDSIEEFISDLISKLRECCSDVRSKKKSA